MIGSPVVHGEAKGQVEVAVIKRAIPSHAELAAAHQAVHRVRIKRFPKKLHVPLSLISPDQVCLKSSQRHIRDGEKVSERDFKPLAQLAAVILF
jgi:hypothetical protein